MWDTEEMVLGKQGPTPPMPSSTGFAEVFALVRPWEGGVVFSLPFLPSFISKVKRLT